jgi:hypothetical protein
VDYGPGSKVDAFAAAGNAGTFTMPAVNNCWAGRFRNTTNKKPKAVKVSWGSINTPGQSELRIETIDASTGKPTGTLYNANATLQQAIAGSTGWQSFQFASLPSAALALETDYAIVLLTKTTGTTQTLRSSVNLQGTYPAIVLQAADGSDRANLAEQAALTPIFTIVWEDDTETAPAGCPYDSSTTPTGCYGTRAWGSKLVIPVGLILPVYGVAVRRLTRTGTPSDLRCRILNSADALVSGCTVTLDADQLTGVAGARAEFLFPAPVDLPAGTYRAVFDQNGASSSGNNYQTRHPTASSSALVPAEFMATATDDYTAGTITWTDSPTQTPPITLLCGAPSAAGGGGGGVNGLLSQFGGGFN